MQSMLAGHMYATLLEVLDSWGARLVAVQEIGAVLYHAAELQRQAEDELQRQADAEAERQAAQAETARQAAEALADQAAASLLADKQTAVAAIEKQEADQQAAELRAQKLAAAQQPQQQVPEAAPQQQTAGAVALAAARAAEAPQAPVSEAAITQQVELSSSCMIPCRHTALCKHALPHTISSSTCCTKQWSVQEDGPAHPKGRKLSLAIQDMAAVVRSTSVSVTQAQVQPQEQPAASSADTSSIRPPGKFHASIWIWYAEPCEGCATWSVMHLHRPHNFMQPQTCWLTLHICCHLSIHLGCCVDLKQVCCQALHQRRP